MIELRLRCFFVASIPDCTGMGHREPRDPRTASKTAQGWIPEITEQHPGLPGLTSSRPRDPGDSRTASRTAQAWVPEIPEIPEQHPGLHRRGAR